MSGVIDVHVNNFNSMWKLYLKGALAVHWKAWLNDLPVSTFCS